MNKQQLNVTLSIPIPEDMVLIKKVELEELQQDRLIGVYWTMSDLENRIGKNLPPATSFYINRIHTIMNIAKKRDKPWDYSNTKKEEPD